MFEVICAVKFHLSYDFRYFGSRVQHPNIVNSLLGLEAGLR